VKQKIGGKSMKYKNRRDNEQNKEHDKIIQYFPQLLIFLIYRPWACGSVESF
jgi:hypothetical protein